MALGKSEEMASDLGLHVYTCLAVPIFRVNTLLSDLCYV